MKVVIHCEVPRDHWTADGPWAHEEIEIDAYAETLERLDFTPLVANLVNRTISVARDAQATEMAQEAQ